MTSSAATKRSPTRLGLSRSGSLDRCARFLSLPFTARLTSVHSSPSPLSRATAISARVWNARSVPWSGARLKVLACW